MPFFLHEFKQHQHQQFALLQDFANLMGLPAWAMPASSAFEVDSLAAECRCAPSMSCSCGAGREGKPNTSPTVVAQLAEVVDGILRDLGEDPARQVPQCLMIV